ncbi:hypothetical protein BR63_00430 [Thermanaerosceptrum fracticalcis]|uniref:Uncharacterized protein n=1 Tax=Thermanaerosceptrum fracticalcis TaxID=1712410 RepID=A0A7G6DYM3_THEFR|nr:hypothetical protein [Thermanaerosceptrum fracticalcis]QNB44927.1 hypothetical protein BR63_00430 [Thermanaerosceptrum fracticalcis]
MFIYHAGIITLAIALVLLAVSSLTGGLTLYTGLAFGLIVFIASVIGLYEYTRRLAREELFSFLYNNRDSFKHPELVAELRKELMAAAKNKDKKQYEETMKKIWCLNDPKIFAFLVNEGY